MNTVMMVTFGAGIEKIYGIRPMLIIYFGSVVIAALTHLAFDPNSMIPVVGASGGISGLFGAILIMMRDQSRHDGVQQNLLPFIVLWIGITVVFGFMGGPDGSSVAWIAHIGGFLGGLAIASKVLRSPN
jgi:membrane associated rhomboid family serine protease